MIEQDAANVMASEAIRLVVDSGKVVLMIAGSGAERIAAMLMAAWREQSKTKGAMRLTNMVRSNPNTEMYSLPIDKLKEWNRRAKQYGIVYAVVKTDNRDNLVDISIRAQDAARVNRVVERFNIIDFNKLGNIHTERQPELDVPTTEAGRDDIDDIVSDILAPEGDTEISSENVQEQSEPTPEDILDMDENHYIPDGDGISLGEKVAFAVEAVPSTDDTHPVKMSPEAALQEVLLPQMDDEEVEQAFINKQMHNGAHDNKEILSTPTEALPGSGRPSEKLSSKNGNVSKASSSWNLARQGINVKEYQINQSDIDWPLSNSRNLYSPEQQAEIQACFEKGLSIEQVERIAKPAAPPAEIRRMRIDTRPSVRAAIQHIRSEHAEHIAEKAAEVIKVLDVGKER